MAWRFFETYGVSDEGAMIQLTDDGWLALPFGSSGAPVGCFADRDEAAETAAFVLGANACCSDLGEPS